MKTFILYDDTRSNADGSRVLLQGIRLVRFQKNPIMLYMHNRSETNKPDGSEVIGRWENIRIDKNRLLADAVFDEEDPFAIKIANKVKKGFLKGASMGIDVHKTSDLQQHKLPQQTGITITESTLLEASIVDIPQNENALNHCAMYQHFGYNTCITANKQSHDFFLAIKKQLKIVDTISEKELLNRLEKEINNIQNLQTWKLQFLNKQADKLLQKYLADNIISEQEVQPYKMRFLTDFDATQETLEELSKQHPSTKPSKVSQFLSKLQVPVPPKAVAPASFSESGDSVYHQFLKNEPKKLKTLQQQNPAAFRQLLEAHLAWKINKQ